MTEIIAKERPDALLPNLGGQSGLNLSSELAKAGVLDKYGVKVIGVQIDAIERGEDRQAFKETMDQPGHRDAAQRDRQQRRGGRGGRRRRSGYPCVIRPAYTMGGTGGGFVYNMEELRAVAERGHRAPAWSARSWSRSRCSAGRSWSWRSCATPRTR